MVNFCPVVITTRYRCIVKCREHIASYVTHLCGIVTQALQHILHRMKIYLLQSAPNNIIRDVYLLIRITGCLTAMVSTISSTNSFMSIFSAGWH